MYACAVLGTTCGKRRRDCEWWDREVCLCGCCCCCAGVLPQRKFKDAKSMVPQLTKAQLALPRTQSECCQAAGCTASSASAMCVCVCLHPSGGSWLRSESPISRLTAGHVVACCVVRVLCLQEPSGWGVPLAWLQAAYWA